MSDEIMKEQKTIKKKVYKAKTKDSPLDITVNNILARKKEKGYAYKEYSEEECQLLANNAINIWDNEISNDEKAGFDNDKLIFILMYLVSESFNYEQIQIQDMYGVDKDVKNGIETITLKFHQGLSLVEKLEGGYFTPAEKNEIAEQIYPLSQSVYRKYVPGDDYFIGPYERDDIKEAINLGITRALNSYVPFSEKFKVSFSSWAYTCMNNACLDVLKHFDTKKEKVKIVSLEDTGAYDNGLDDGDKRNNKNILDGLANNEGDNELYKSSEAEGRKEFLSTVFTNMLKEGDKKEIEKEIFIIKMYFGLISGESETMVSISKTTNMKIEQVKKYFASGKERLVRTVYKMGYSTEDIMELFL